MADFSGDMSGFSATVKVFAQVGTPEAPSWKLVDTTTSPLTAVGRFTVSPKVTTTSTDPANNPIKFAVVIKVSRWLTSLTNVQTLLGGSTQDLSVTLPYNGDITLDDRVTLQDLNIVKKALGSTPGSSTWNAAADLNGDGKVDNADLEICTKNQGKTGDRP